jgi:hypothetical protein
VDPLQVDFQDYLIVESVMVSKDGLVIKIVLMTYVDGMLKSGESYFKETEGNG